MISAGLGALIGLVRQWAWQQDHPQESEYAGVRTFTIWALLGCATALISERFGVAVFSVALAGLCLYLIAARVMSRPEQAEGYTTFAVMMETFFLGALVYSGERGIAVMLAAGTMVLLGSKRPISRWTRKFTSSDMFNVLQFVAITGVVLPSFRTKATAPSPRSIPTTPGSWSSSWPASVSPATCSSGCLARRPASPWPASSAGSPPAPPPPSASAAGAGKRPTFRPSAPSP